MRLLTLFALAPLTLSAGPAYKDVSRQLAPILEKHDGIPSLAAAAVLNGKLVAAGATGKRKAGRPELVTLEDKYHLGSCTKAMTATLAAIMVREGLIAWDSTPDDLLKGVRVHRDLRKVTLEQLLSNTAGLPKKIPEPLRTEIFTMDGRAERQRRALAKGILALKPHYEPGQGYEYSNSGFSVAGAMLEEAAGKPWEDLMREKLFKPLGMTSAGFRAPGESGKLLHPYGHRDGPVDPEPRGDNPRGIAPAGAVHATITDWAKFAALHLGHGPEGLLAGEDLAFLHEARNRDHPYALGWSVTERPWAGGTCLTHTGSNTMWYSVIWLAPEMDFAAMAATNTGSKEGFALIDAAVGFFIQRYLMNAK